MTRKLKFREWIKEKGEMRHFILGQQVTSGIYGLFECPVMQYTGLKDKNGVEIYVGDIVRDLSFNSQLGQTAGEVVFENGCYWVKDGQMLGGKNYQAVVEVVGNIYQHPIRLAKFNKENND